MGDLLVIVPCGQSKIWDRKPDIGSVRASDAYTGVPFRLNCQYARRFGDRWLILSAKYGFIEPEFTIRGPYNVTFKRKSSQPVTDDELWHQVKKLQLVTYSTIVGLGGKEYRAALVAAFDGCAAHIVFPFAGLPIGKSMQAVKRAIRENRAYDASG